MHYVPIVVSAALLSASPADAADRDGASLPRNVVSLAAGASVFPTTYGSGAMGPSYGLQYERVILDGFSLSLRPGQLLALGTQSQLFGWTLGIGAKWFPHGAAPEGVWLAPEVLFIGGIYAWEVREAQVGFRQAAPGAGVGYTWLLGMVSTSLELGANFLRVKGDAPPPDWDRDGPAEHLDALLFDVHLRATIGLAF